MYFRSNNTRNSRHTREKKPFTRPTGRDTFSLWFVIQFFFMKLFSIYIYIKGYYLLFYYDYRQIYLINVNNVMCRWYYVMIFCFRTIVCVLAFKYHFRVFTHDLILPTSLELLLFVPGAIPVQYSLIYVYPRNDIRFLSVFIDWYTFQLQEVRKRFFCFRKKSSPAKTTYCDLTVVPERFRYLGILCNGIPTYLIWIPTPIDLIVGSYTWRINISIICIMTITTETDVTEVPFLATRLTMQILDIIL